VEVGKGKGKGANRDERDTNSFSQRLLFGRGDDDEADACSMGACATVEANERRRVRREEGGGGERGEV